MENELENLTTYHIDGDILKEVHATPADNWLDFILED